MVQKLNREDQEPGGTVCSSHLAPSPGLRCPTCHSCDRGDIQRRGLITDKVLPLCICGGTSAHLTGAFRGRRPGLYDVSGGETEARGCSDLAQPTWGKWQRPAHPARATPPPSVRAQQGCKCSWVRGFWIQQAVAQGVLGQATVRPLWLVLGTQLLHSDATQIRRALRSSPGGWHTFQLDPTLRL